MKQVRRIMNPIFVCILAISLTLTGIPHSAIVMKAEAESVKSGTISEDLIWQYSSDGTLMISGNGSMPDYTTENNYYTGITTDVPWGDYLNDITKVVVNGNVNNIGKCAFSDCISIKEVSLSSSVKEIGESAFARCTGLNSISFPNVLVSIGDDAFRGCTGITNVIIPDSVTTIGSGAFQACTNLTDISIGKSISSIKSYTFCNCMKLTNIEIPQNVTSIGIYAFSLCSTISELNIPISVNSISDEAFSNCSSLKKVTVNNNSLYFGQRVFDNCASNFVLYGNNGSTSETYAEKNAHVFVIMDAENSSLKDNNSRYKLINDSKTWNEAKTYCEQIGGHLATITSEDEQQIIEGLLKNQGEKNCYLIGGYKENNQWKWINGEPFNFSNWDYGEPNGYHDDEYYIEIYGKEEKEYKLGKWNDMVDEGDNISSSWHKLEYTGFICEWDNVSDGDDKKDTAIAVLTTEKSLRVKTGKSMWMGFGMLDENSGLLDDKWEKMSVVVSNPTVIALSDYTETEYGYSIEVIGKKQDATNITITDTESGINTIVTVFVQDDYANTYSYAINDIASFYPNNDFEKNIETNIYDLNGLYINKYKCTKSTNSYNISFDIYNSKYYSGAVDIYDENGMWMGYEEIDKYSNISSFWDTGEQAYFLISDTITGKMLTYEQASFSKYTHIDIEVPEGGYFTISNNISESPGIFFINAFEILFEGTCTAFDLFTSGDTKESALTSFKREAKKSFATRLIESRNEGLKDNVKRQSQKIMLDSMKSKIKKITKENIKTGLKDKLTSTDTMCSDIASLAEDMLAPQSFNIEWKPMFESATGIGESFFTEFSGLAGIALKGCFVLNDSTSKILMAKQMVESTGKPYVTIFSSVDTGYINPYGVMVNTNGNIDAESVLQVFRVSDSDAIEVLLDSSNPLEIHELYNICFVKDDTLVQPNGKVMVQIPIPQGMKGNTCKVYRQETNGNWTILDAKVQGNYLVFETDHFSLYALIGESDNLVISSLPNKTNYQNGEILDTNGLVLDLNGQLITEGYICEPTVLSGNGKQFVKVTYGHSVTEFEVNIEKETPTKKPDDQPTETSNPNQPTALPTESPTVSSSITIDTKTIVGKMKYKVTKVNNNGAGEVTLIGTTRKKSDKRFTALKVGNTVRIKGESFKITAIGNNAFHGYKKLKSVTVGKNVKKIGTKAFYGCKNLKKIIIMTKQLQTEKVGNKAFKGIYSKVNIKVPKPKLKSYKKILRVKGVGKRAKIHT